MLKANDEQVLEVFRKVHGELSGSCYEQILYDEDCDILGVACMKDGNVCWRATLAELLFDNMVLQNEEILKRPASTDGHTGFTSA